MNRVILDEAARAKLRGVDEVELCDESGQPLGHFLSDALYRRLLYDWANAQISDEELERRRRQPGGHALADIWARLQNS
ncbi:MAG: hypothetical protein A2V98_18725 [Planctomycetes bacterium RBG_16_64_12]|nr:MAG: hypothetical protein A2V98_18725 [Planctomycetes bacterium RBG_16_64_12]